VTSVSRARSLYDDCGSRLTFSKTTISLIVSHQCCKVCPSELLPNLLSLLPSCWHQAPAQSYAQCQPETLTLRYKRLRGRRITHLVCPVPCALSCPVPSPARVACAPCVQCRVCGSRGSKVRRPQGTPLTSTRTRFSAGTAGYHPYLRTPCIRPSLGTAISHPCANVTFETMTQEISPALPLTVGTIPEAKTRPRQSLTRKRACSA
jgi:hypothetical protein